MSFKSKSIAFGGISTALVLLSLYGGNIFINSKVSLLAAATYLTSLPYIISGIGGGMLSYGASFLLALLLLPNKLYAAAYALFGIYPLVKLLCEKYKTGIEYILKFLWFNLSLIIGYVFFREVIYINYEVLTEWSLVLVVIVLQGAFIVYDYVFTRVIVFFEDRIINRL